MRASDASTSAARGCRSRPALSAALGAILLASSVARAQPSEAQLEQARLTYASALELEATGDWSGALAKMREVAGVKLTAQVRFHLARCQSKLGRWTEAVATYRLAIADADAQGALDVRREASAALSELEPAVPTLRIERGASAAGAAIELDGAAIPEASIGTSLDVDPGLHRVEAHMGERRAVATVTLAARERRTLAIDLPAVDGVAPPAPAATATTPPPDRESAPLAPPIVAGSVAVVGLATAGIFWGLRAGTVSDLDARCVGGHCPVSLESTAQRGKVFTVVAASGLAVGAVGLGVFTWLMLRQRPARPGVSASSASSAFFAPSIDIGFGPTGVAARGEF